MPLHHGITGDFYNRICAAYCSDTLMAWTEGKYHYIIGLEAESKLNMIRAANRPSTMQTDGNSLRPATNRHCTH